MAKGRVAQIVSQGDSLRQAFIEPQRFCDGPRNLGNLQGVGQARPVMVAFRRESSNGKYVCVPTLVPLTDVANFEKKVPQEWITADGTGVTQDFIDYALPLIAGEPERPTENSLPRYARLKKVLAK